MINTHSQLNMMTKMEARLVSYHKTTNFRRKILLVDDNEINLRVAKCFLHDLDITDIDIAHSGKEALNLISDETDLIILDIGLPDINGISVCEAIRKLKNKKSIPIIAHTANVTLTKAELLKHGFDDVLYKPVLYDEFKTTIQHYLND